MNQSLYIIGAGGHATSIAEIAIAANFNLRAFISHDSSATELWGLPILTAIPQKIESNSIILAIAIGDNYQREMVFKNLMDQFPIESFPALIHPSASIALKATVGFGTTIHQNATVGSNTTVGNFCTLNSGSITDHDCQISDFASLGPGANLGGNVTLGHRAVVAIGSTVRHGVTIAEDSILGAASYAHIPTEAKTVSVGSPARIIRTREAGDKYL